MELGKDEIFSHVNPYWKLPAPWEARHVGTREYDHHSEVTRTATRYSFVLLFVTWESRQSAHAEIWHRLWGPQPPWRHPDPAVTHGSGTLGACRWMRYGNGNRTYILQQVITADPLQLSPFVSAGKVAFRTAVVSKANRTTAELGARTQTSKQPFSHVIWGTNRSWEWDSYETQSYRRHVTCYWFPGQCTAIRAARFIKFRVAWSLDPVAASAQVTLHLRPTGLTLVSQYTHKINWQTRRSWQRGIWSGR